MTDQLLVPRELLERIAGIYVGGKPRGRVSSFDELRTLLAQPADCEPKPVGYVWPEDLANNDYLVCSLIKTLEPYPVMIPLFTHPAPAGVVIPERKQWGGLLPTAENLKTEGWNACREETARLNGVKP